MKEDVKGSDINMSIGIVRSDGSDKKILFSKDVKSLSPWQVAWYPDNKRLAFYLTKRDPNVKKIYVFDIEKNKISEPLWDLKNAKASWGLDGLDYSPDGKFLIFPELVNGFIELVALPVKNLGTERAGNLRVLTNLSGKGIPFWPEFTASGKSLSIGIKEHNVDINIASLEINDAKIASTFYNITKSMDIEHYGCWSSDGRKIAYIAERSFQNDIYLKNLETKEIKRITNSSEDEIKLKFMPDDSSVSYLTRKLQLWKVALDRNKSELIFPSPNFYNQYEIHDYAWGANANILFVAVLKKNENVRKSQLLQFNLVSADIIVN